MIASELSFTIVCADFDPAAFSVTLCKNCPVSVTAPLIDCDACLDGVDVVVFPVWFIVVAFVWACTELKLAIKAVNVIPKSSLLKKPLVLLYLLFPLY